MVGLGWVEILANSLGIVGLSNLSWIDRETFLQWDVLSLMHDLGWLLLRSRP